MQLAPTEDPSGPLQLPAASTLASPTVVGTDTCSTRAGAAGTGETGFMLAMYPHIQDGIIQNASPQTLAVLRATSRDMRGTVTPWQPMIEYDRRVRRDRTLYVSIRRHGLAGNMLETKEWNMDHFEGWSRDERREWDMLNSDWDFDLSPPTFSSSRTLTREQTQSLEAMRTRIRKATAKRMKEIHEYHAKVAPWVVDIVGEVEAMRNMRVPVVRLRADVYGILSEEAIMAAHTVVVSVPFPSAHGVDLPPALAFPALSHFDPKAAKRIVFNVPPTGECQQPGPGNIEKFQRSFPPWSEKSDTKLCSAVIIFPADLVDSRIVTGSLALEVTGLLVQHPGVAVTVVNAENVQPSLLGRDGCFYDHRPPYARIDLDPCFATRMGADHTGDVKVPLDHRVTADVTAALARIMGTEAAQAAAARVRFLTEDEYRATLYPGQWEMETEGMLKTDWIFKTEGVVDTAA